MATELQSLLSHLEKSGFLNAGRRVKRAYNAGAANPQVPKPAAPSQPLRSPAPGASLPKAHIPPVPNRNMSGTEKQMAGAVQAAPSLVGLGMSGVMNSLRQAPGRASNVFTNTFGFTPGQVWNAVKATPHELALAWRHDPNSKIEQFVNGMDQAIAENPWGTAKAVGSAFIPSNSMEMWAMATPAGPISKVNKIRNGVQVLGNTGKVTSTGLGEFERAVRAHNTAIGNGVLRKVQPITKPSWLVPDAQLTGEQLAELNAMQQQLIRGQNAMARMQESASAARAARSGAKADAAFDTARFNELMGGGGTFASADDQLELFNMLKTPEGQSAFKSFYAGANGKLPSFGSGRFNYRYAPGAAAPDQLPGMLQHNAMNQGRAGSPWFQGTNNWWDNRMAGDLWADPWTWTKRVGTGATVTSPVWGPWMFGGGGEKKPAGGDFVPFDGGGKP